MSLKTLKLMSRSYLSDEDAMDRAAEHDAAQRSKPTPAAQLPAKTRALFKELCKLLPSSLVVRPHGDKSPRLRFRLDLERLAATPPRDDVVKGAINMFVDLGFSEARHSHNVGVNTLDWLELTAPADWVERLLKPLNRR